MQESIVSLSLFYNLKKWHMNLFPPMKYSLPIINIVWYQNNLGSYVSLKIKFALPELAVLYINVQFCTVLTICVPGLTGYCNCCPVAQSSSSASSGIDLNTLLILGNICFPFFFIEFAHLFKILGFVAIQILLLIMFLFSNIWNLQQRRFIHDKNVLKVKNNTRSLFDVSGKIMFTNQEYKSVQNWAYTIWKMNPSSTSNCVRSIMYTHSFSDCEHYTALKKSTCVVCQDMLCRRKHNLLRSHRGSSCGPLCRHSGLRRRQKAAKAWGLQRLSLHPQPGRRGGRDSAVFAIFRYR